MEFISRYGKEKECSDHFFMDRYVEKYEYIYST